MPRLVMRFEDWPDADRDAWTAAILSGDILDGQGPAAHWRPATRRTNFEHYGRWLGHLDNNGNLDRLAPPAARVTPGEVRHYIDGLKERLSPRTVVSVLVGLKVMMKAMAPATSWRWLIDICNALNRNSRPMKDKRSRMKPTDEIVERALAELDRLGAGKLDRRIARVAYRDNLMLALLALRPLRLTNFAGLRIGTSLRPVAGKWLMDIPGDETKNGLPLLFEVPGAVQPYFERYLERVRPVFLAKAEVREDALWLGFEGRSLTAHSVYLRFIFLTTKLFGAPINPHLLRDCAATTLSTRSVDDALASASLLGHRSFKTTEAHYIRANQLEASRNVGDVLQKIKDSIREP